MYISIYMYIHAYLYKYFVIHEYLRMHMCSRPFNSQRAEEAGGFAKCYSAFVTELREHARKRGVEPAVIVCRPPKMFDWKEFDRTYDIMLEQTDKFLSEGGDVYSVDVHKALDEAGLFVDGVHPTREGAEKLAQAAATCVLQLEKVQP